MISGVQSRVTKPKPGVQLNPAHPLSKGLVAYWLFNEGSGSVAHDISGFGNHGTLTDMSPNAQGSGWGASKFGGGLAFDGTNDCVEVPDHSSLDIADGVTINLWLKPKSLPFSSYAGIVRKGNTAEDRPNNYMVQSVASSNNIQITYSHASNDNEWLMSNTGITLGWNHVTWVIDVGNRAELIYINGSLDTSKSVSAESMITNDYPLWVGKRHDYAVDCILDNVSIYNRALAAHEIKKLYEDPFCNLLSPRRWYVPAAGPSGVIMNQFQRSNIGADLFNGGLQ